jgi:hypothetical protein
VSIPESIFPRLYIGVVAFLSFRGLVQLSPHDLAFALSYLMNYHHNCAWIFGHFWVPYVEEQFYLIRPVLVVVLGFRWSMTAVVTYLFIAQVGRIEPAGSFRCFQSLTSGKHLSTTGDSHRPAVAETGAATGELRD